MFKVFQVKKLVLCSVVALGMVGLANADSIKCDSKEAIIAFATQACELSTFEVNELRKNGFYSDDAEGVWSKLIMLDGKTLECATPGEEADTRHIYSNFKTIKADKNKVKCRARVQQMIDGRDSNYNVDFTLRNGLIAEIEIM